MSKYHNEIKNDVLVFIKKIIEPVKCEKLERDIANTFGILSYTLSLAP